MIASRRVNLVLGGFCEALLTGAVIRDLPALGVSLDGLLAGLIDPETNLLLVEEGRLESFLSFLTV